ncbi:MAG: diguanylate cyclase, partial [Ruminiclostridium sp.]|nr:diguanylate cyclase [Ruminiclostridium sp.]
MRLSTKWIKKRYLTVIIVFAFLLFAGSSVLFLSSVVSNLNSQTEGLAHDMVHGKRAAIDAMIRSDVSTITNYAACSSKYKSRSKIELMSELKNLTEDSRMLNIIVINEQGDVTSYRNEVINVSHREYFKAAMRGEITISETLYSEPDGRMVNVIAAPIYGDYQRVIGVVAGMCSPDEYKDILDLSVTGHEDNAIGYVMNSNGDVLMRGENLFGDYIPIEDNLFTSTFVSAISENELAVLKDEFNKREAHGMVVSEDNGEEYIAYYSTLEVDPNLHYVAMFKSDTISGKLHGYIERTVILFFFFLGLLLFVMISYFIFIHYSFSALKKASEENAKLAYVDNITGYGTWNKFEKDASYLLSHGYRKYAFICFDIDKFKAVNDMFGHEEGNRILKLIADIVNRNISNQETFSRVNSDNFYLLLVYKSDADILDRLRKITYAIEYEINNFLPVISYGIYRVNGSKLSVRKMGDLAVM